MISCGAGDGIIKVWDLRRNYSTYKKEPHPKHSLPYAGGSTFKGFTNLIVDEAGAHLYANCMDNTIYCYNLHSYSPKPLARYRGLLNSTFYIKSCLSPDGKYLLSGSSDEKAYIWNLKYPDEPLVGLSGHTVEVTCVAWGSTDDRPIVTCSDDARHKIWRIGPEQISVSDLQENYRGNAEYVMKFTKPSNPSASTHKYNLRDLESTPRSLKRLVEQNERTPNTVEKVATKRSFLEMLGAAATNQEGVEVDAELQENKRQKTLETRGRRLFSPCTSNIASSVASTSLGLSARCLQKQLASIPEEHNSSNIASPIIHRDVTNNDSNQENTQHQAVVLQTPPSSIGISKIFPTINTTPSPLTERRPPVLDVNLNAASYTSPPSTSLQAATAAAAMSVNQTHTSVPNMIYSPTSNLPNYVLDGEAPHLCIMSPKRKLKDKVDWLTKMRKQKLLSSCRGTTLTEKMQNSMHNVTHGHDSNSGEGGGGPVTAVASPRLQSLRQSESSPKSSTPRRRLSQSQMSPSSPHQPRTPTSSRRNSETTLLRFFSKQSSQSSPITSRQDLVATTSSLASADVGEMRPLSPGPSVAELTTNNVPSDSLAPITTVNNPTTTSLPTATTCTTE